MIKETTGTDTPIENIPEELAERPQWVCWRYEERDEKLTKVPYTPTGAYTPDQKASTTDLMTWGTFEAAYRALDNEVRHYDGIGFVFSSADPFVGIDLDDCRDPETGAISGWAQKIIERVSEGYTEISPSGEGVHVIVEGTVRGGRTRKKVRVNGEVVGQVEMYGHSKFFTVTGRIL
jgi:primase-polymerase (primpol)-like protein